MVMGSSGLPGRPVISCIMAFPVEVTRSVKCMILPSNSGPAPESTPSQEPARVFKVLNDFWASDDAAVVVPDWAKPAAHNHNEMSGNIKRADFMVQSP